MSERVSCSECSLRSIEQSDRLQICSEFVQTILQEWWHGNPTMELNEVAMDYFRTNRYAGEVFGDAERGPMDNCLAEHSLAHCDNFNPYHG